MTGVETNPSLLPDTPPASQNNTVTDVGVIEPAGGTPPAESEATAPGVAGEQGSGPYPFTQGVDDGRPRTRIVVRPRWSLPDEEVEGTAPAANDTSEADPVREQPTDSERERLNWIHSYYRGTVAGAIEQHVLHGLSHLQEGEEETPRRRAEIAFYRPLYLNVVRDLDHADQLLRIADVTKASLTHSADTTPAAPEITPPPVDSWAFAKRALPAAKGQSPFPTLPQRKSPTAITDLSASRRRRKPPTPEEEAFYIQAAAEITNALYRWWSPKSSRNTGTDELQSKLSKVVPELDLDAADPSDLALTGNPAIDVTQKLLYLTAKRIRPAEFIRGKPLGDEMHLQLARIAPLLDFEEVSKRLKIPELSNFGFVVEQNYYFGRQIDPNIKDVVRPDVVLVLRNNEVPIAIFDLKTGGARPLGTERVRELQRGVGALNIPVFELRMTETMIKIIRR